ncbi:MAG: cytochrome c maturation protein CcmE [Alphaproteobacteria bacterium]|nr:cytochrome c maturation protein CcmE [Alphaproteobacteria bacterium]
MKPKRRRLLFVLIGLALLGGAVALALSALRDTMVFFYAPTELAEKPPRAGASLRVGGLVEEGSVVRDGTQVTFRITDLTSSVPVTYTGVLPDLFREGQGIVVEGKLQPDGTFAATRVLAKHDEKYMPPEVAEALKKSGQWRPDVAKT